MSQQKIARRGFRHTQLDRLVHGLADDRQARPQHGFRQHWLQNRHLFGRAAVRAEHWGVDGPRDGLPQRVLLFGPLHQRADDILPRVDAAEEIALRRRLGLAAEHRWVAGVRDEVDQVASLRQISGQWRGDVERDEHDAGSQV